MTTSTIQVTGVDFVCVPVKDIGSVSRVIRLSSDQFQFVRALYVAIPPVSRSLPPGDSAVIRSDDLAQILGIELR